MAKNSRIARIYKGQRCNQSVEMKNFCNCSFDRKQQFILVGSYYIVIKIVKLFSNQWYKKNKLFSIGQPWSSMGEHHFVRSLLFLIPAFGGFSAFDLWKSFSIFWFPAYNLWCREDLSASPFHIHSLNHCSRFDTWFFQVSRLELGGSRPLRARLWRYLGTERDPGRSSTVAEAR